MTTENTSDSVGISVRGGFAPINVNSRASTPVIVARVNIRSVVPQFVSWISWTEVVESIDEEGHVFDELSLVSLLDDAGKLNAARYPNFAALAADGGTVLISQDDEPSLILQAGSYQVVAQYSTKTYTRAFDANPNEVHTIAVTTATQALPTTVISSTPARYPASLSTGRSTPA